MDKWKEIQLGKLGKTYTGLSGKTKEDFGAGKPYIPYLNIFSNNKIKPEQLDFVNIKKGEKQNQVKYGDLFFTTSSETIEEVGMTSVLLHDIGEAYLNSFCFGFRLNDFETLLPEYSPYLFRSETVRHKISLQGQGSTRYNLSKTELLVRLVLNVPPKPEQTRIAEILSTADEAISNTEALIAKYQHIKTGLMQGLLTKGINENGNIRSKETHRFIVKKGIEVPEEWEVDTFNELCTIIKDGTHLPPKRVIDGIWLLGVTNIIDGEWKITKADTQVSEEFYKQMHKNWRIEVGDVLLAIVGATIGKVTQVPNDFPKFTIQRSVCLLRGKKNELSNDFLRLFIESLYFQRLLWNEVNVTAQPGIYLDTIGKFQIRKPLYEEQLLIVDRLNSIKKTIDNLKINLTKLQSIKTGLMQDLLSGKVKVKMSSKN